MFPFSVEEDQQELERCGLSFKVQRKDIPEVDSEAMAVALANCESAQREKLTGSVQEQREREKVRAELQRMRAALIRTQPAQRSCEVRLALADWLHRRLRSSRLCTDDSKVRPRYPRSLLRRYRLPVALLRSMLQRQLSEAASIATDAVPAADPPPCDPSSSQPSSVSERARVESW